MNGALPFVMGFVVGDLVWFIAAAAGLSVLAKTYAPLFVALKYAGCAYLVWIAIQLWRSEPVLPEAGTTPRSRAGGRLSRIAVSHPWQSEGDGLLPLDHAAGGQTGGDIALRGA